MSETKKNKNVVDTSVLSDVEIKDSEPIVVKGSVNVEALNVRKKPSMDSEVLTIIRMSDVLVVDEVLDMFYKVTLSNGSKGYVVKQYIDLI